MLVNKKLDRFKQWAGERMGGEAKTGVSDDFKALEMEMTLRHEGMERLQKSMTTYVKTLSKRSEAEDKEKILPIANLGSTMVAHGEDFEQDSEFGQCLISMGRANEKIARMQEAYVQQATSSWLESLERSLAQMKEYQNSRKKLESRRLAYDTSLTKMQKAKREDFKVEEELRSQKAKYEESSEDVIRRMEDIKEAEADSVVDLGAFLDAELEYYDRCRSVLMKLRNEWPAETQAPLKSNDNRRNDRSRPNPSTIYTTRVEDPPEKPQPKLSIRSTRAPTSRLSASPPDDYDDYSPPQPARPSYKNRSSTFEGPTRIHRDVSPQAPSRVARVPTDPNTVITSRSNLRQVDVFGDRSDDSYTNSSPDNSYQARSASPATSLGSVTPASTGGTSGRRAPPPPPPNRAKKPPPPPPMKRSALSSTT